VAPAQIVVVAAMSGVIAVALVSIIRALRARRPRLALALTLGLVPAAAAILIMVDRFR
jgi:hypothetical protein